MICCWCVAGPHREPELEEKVSMLLGMGFDEVHISVVFALFTRQHCLPIKCGTSMYHALLLLFYRRTCISQRPSLHLGGFC